MIKGFFTALCAVMALVVGVPALAAANTPAEPTITFRGGGWGHGVGMSQYGALGRALAGQTHQEILAFYYDGTSLTDASAFGVSGEVVDVHVATSSSTTLTPVGSNLQLRSGTNGGNPFAVVATSITVTFDGAAWHAVGPHPSPPPEDPGATYDYCGPGCPPGFLSITPGGGGRIVVQGVSEYAHGAIELHPAGGTSFHVVNGSLTLDEYMYGVAEVPASWPAAALAAQAVAARSYAASRVVNPRSAAFDLYSSTSDQVYAGWGQEGACGGWCAAVDLTAGQVLSHSGSIASGFYSSSNGGHTASNTDIWGSAQYPYLRAKPDPFDSVEANPNASWERTLTFSQVEAIVRSLAGSAAADMGRLTGLELRNTPPSGHNSFADVVIHHDASDEPIVLPRKGAALANAVGLLGKRYEIVEFADVPPDAYFALPVEWMVEHGITSGTGPNTFSPGQPNTRAGLATFLHRFADEPPGTVPTPFRDVPRGAYFEQPVGWASDEGIVKGYTPYLFGPAGAVTRADAATMLWRFAGEPQVGGENPFVDVPDDAYFTAAVRWMVEWDITTGTSATTFSPGDVLTRAHIATFLWRLAGQPDAFTDDTVLPSAMRSR